MYIRERVTCWLFSWPLESEGDDGPTAPEGGESGRRAKFRPYLGQGRPSKRDGRSRLDDLAVRQSREFGVGTVGYGRLNLMGDRAVSSGRRHQIKWQARQAGKTVLSWRPGGGKGCPR